MKRLILSLLVLSVAMFAKCDFREGAVNTMAECPQLACIPNATIVKVVPACGCRASVQVVKCVSCCPAPKPVVRTPSCIRILD